MEQINKEAEILEWLYDYLVKTKGYPQDSILKQKPYINKGQKLLFDMVVLDGKEIAEIYELKSNKSSFQNKLNQYKKQAEIYAEVALTFFVCKTKEEVEPQLFQFQKETMNLCAFIKKIKKYANLPNNSEYRWFYRGQPNALENTIIPSIYRNTTDIAKETRYYNEAIRHFPIDFPDSLITFDKLSKMQHFGLKTRLLDVTTNPLVALYFACCNDEEKDGEVILFRINSNDVCFSNDEIVEKISKTTYTDIGSNELNDRENLDKVICVLPKLISQRMISQDSAFLLYGISDVNKKIANPEYIPRRIIIPKECKTAILEELKGIGFDKNNFFPEIESSLKTISES